MVKRRKIKSKYYPHEIELFVLKDISVMIDYLKKKDYYLCETYPPWDVNDIENWEAMKNIIESSLKQLKK